MEGGIFMTRTIKQVISDIESNKHTIFDFEGFNSEKHENLVDELCFLIEKKFGSRYLSEAAREKKASNLFDCIIVYFRVYVNSLFSYIFIFFIFHYIPRLTL